MHSCPVCQKTPRKDQKYCSKACLYLSMSYPKRNCLQCNAVFQPRRDSAKYCSLKCVGRHRAVRTNALPADIPGARWIPLTNGKFALVDAVKFDLLNQHVWAAAPQRSSLGASSHCWYATRVERQDGRSRTIYMHRYVINAPRGYLVDHVNGNGLDNRAQNLRIANPSQNSSNARRVNKTGFRGVSKLTDGAFISRVVKDGKQYWTGRFKTAEDAARAYDKLARKLLGQFCRPNFPNPGEFGAR